MDSDAANNALNRNDAGTLRPYRLRVRPHRGASVVAVVVGAIVVLGLVAQMIAALMRPDWFGSSHDSLNVAVDVLGDGTGALVVGVLLAVRLPKNPIGWLLLGFAGAQVLCTGSGAIATAAYQSPGHVSRLGEVGLILFNPSGYLAVAALAPIIALQPTGRLAGGWRRQLLGISALISAAGVVAYSLAPTISDEAGHPHPNPIRIGGHVVVGVRHAALSLGSLVILIFVVDAVVRGRRAAGVEHQQMRLLGYAAAGTICLLLVSGSLPQSSIWNSVLWGAGANLFAIAVGVALVRYRLYDLDRLVSRSLSYAFVSGVLVGSFYGMVVLATRVLGFSSPVAVSASTLAAAALFTPVRRRVQKVVDHRFNRARYDAEAIQSAFAGRMTQKVDFDDIVQDLLTVVNASLEPRRSAVWLVGSPARRIGVPSTE